jgi:nucleoid-associated protein YgaU
VIEALVWDRAIELRSKTSGRRLRCGGTITIREFITSRDILRKIGPRTRASIPRTYVVKKGDNLSKIANWFYKDPGKWKIIADANHMRDGRKLKVGKRLKIPRL